MWALKVASCLTLLVPVAISWPLWRSDRPFPTVPWIPGLHLPAPLDLLLALAWVGVLMGVLVAPRPRRLAWAATLLACALILFDQNRLQPWLYEFLLLFPALASVRWDSPDPEGNRHVRRMFVIALAAIYFHSGLQKMHPAFGEDVFATLVEPFVGRPAWVVLVGGGAPFLEAAIGLLLVFGPTRRLGAALAIAMHAFLLVVLGPLGHAYNAVVWPWNLGMAALVWLAAWRDSEPLWPAVWASWSARFAAILFGAMPFLNHVGLWDSYPSFSLYSDRVLIGKFSFRPLGAMKLPDELSPYLRQRADGSVDLDVLKWSLETIRVPVYPEERVYRAIADGFCRRGVRSDEIGLVFRDPPTLFSARPSARVVACCRQPG